MARVKSGARNLNQRKNVFGRPTGGGSVSIGASSVNLDLQLEAGENLTAGWVCYIAADGKVYKSTALLSDSKPAQFFVVSTVASGDTALIRFAGEVIVPVSGTAGDLAYLRTDTNNISTTPLTVKSGSEDIQQIVGVFTDTNELLINLGTPVSFI